MAKIRIETPNSTSTRLLNDTMDATLAHCRHAERVAMIGPVQRLQAHRWVGAATIEHGSSRAAPPRPT